MDSDEPSVQLRKNVENRSLLHEKELDSLKNHYEKEMDSLKNHYETVNKRKEDRLVTANSSLRSLEEENEKLKSENYEIREEKRRLTTNLNEKMLRAQEAGAKNEFDIEKLQNRYSDLEKQVDGWRNIDLSTLYDGDNLNNEHIQKKLQYYAIESRQQQEYIQTSRDIISSLENQIEFIENSPRTQGADNNGFFMKIFGNKKREVDKLMAENALLRSREQSVTKLMAGHQIRIDNITSEFEKIVIKDGEKKTIEHPQTNDDLIKELEEFKEIIAKKDLAIAKMKKRVESLLEEKKKYKEEVLIQLEENKKSIEEVCKLEKQIESLEHKNHILNGKLNRTDLEYEQMGQKYQNAMKRIEILQESRATNNTSSESPGRSDVACGTSIGTITECCIVPQVERYNTFQSPDHYITKTDGPKEQVCDMPTDAVTCPNCDGNFRSSKIESHLDDCLDAFN